MSHASSYRGLRSLALCSLMNAFCLWRICINNDSKQVILIPLLQGFNSSMVCSAFQYPCHLICVRRKLKQGCLFLCIVCVLCVSFLSIFQSVRHMNYWRFCFYVPCMFYMSHSYRLPVCPTYDLLQVLFLCIVNVFMSYSYRSTSLSNVWVIAGVAFISYIPL